MRKALIATKCSLWNHRRKKVVKRLSFSIDNCDWYLVIPIYTLEKNHIQNLPNYEYRKDF